MVPKAELVTERILLRCFSTDDCRDVVSLLGDPDIAANTLNIPYPYEYSVADDWIKSHEENFKSGKGAVFAITDRETGKLIGAIGLNIEAADEKAELGYWIGKKFWHAGYATEAGKAILEYGFTSLGLNRIFARHLGRNPASGRVMQKLGMKHEGCLRRDIKKSGRFEDLELYGILKDDYEKHLKNINSQILKP
ncbi:MAG: GNAT family N-acetyltransferase [Dehalococcoidales bacterium]|nr:GNAT family N-acetyltransferase [Dehalococcoidales bacterium]MDD3264688.1 GNAT family N-acetyltransferase [Dehalococcoidales bacterium]MDD4322523.1 GNAT family N-acetyltransferase [Dehalococcoidales bacterium]MDD4794102.1 GNAT family N-acetyltransferase [Dehalococcoidales bacterium]MDD5121976.1 GNAT family N-acetyltransferase [Dehalococcoidales bacterium]